MEDPICTVEQGKLKGKIEKDIDGSPFCSFLGIPYAKPPVGNLRFRDPQPAADWDGVLDATKEGSMCYARHLNMLSEGAKMEPAGSEDCLFLNVFTTTLSTNAKRAVMVFIHGGAFIMGSSSPAQYGPQYLMTQDVVFVSINYRLGALGFLQSGVAFSDVPGNAGLKDMVLALKWVQRNIRQFGGNPDNVTVFGESAGAAATHYLVLSPLAKGLFNRAIMQSGCALSPWAHGENDALKLARHLGYEGGRIKVIDFLTEQPVEKILEAQQKVAGEIETGGKIAFGPGIEFKNDSAFISEEPAELLNSGKFNHVDIIMGYNTMESMFLLMWEQKNALPTGGLRKRPVVLSPHIYNLKSDDPRYEEKTAKALKFYEEYRVKHDLSEDESAVVASTDTQFLRGLYKSALATAKLSKKPVFFYRFSLDAKLNTFKIALGAQMKGACHADELGYLFKNAIMKFEPGSLEEKSVRRMVKLWTNFAKSGKPTAGADRNGPLEDVEWKSVDGRNGVLRYLDIGEELISGVNPEEERMKLWDEIAQGIGGIAKYY